MKELIRSRIDAVVKDLYGVQSPVFKVEKPKDESLGDLASNVAFLLSRNLKKNPNEIAGELAKKLSEDDLFESVEALRGFINLRLSRNFVVSEFKKLLLEGEDFFREDLGRGLRVQIEFVSANPTGPLHLGHGRGAVVGDTLARLLSFYGFDVTREYYINDAGRQVYLLGVSVLYRYLELFGREKDRPQIQKLFEKEGYRGEYVVEIARNLKEAVGDTLLSTDRVSEAREKILSFGFEFPLEYTSEFSPGKEPDVKLCSSFGLDMMMNEIREDLASMGIEFDSWFSETSLYKRGLVDKLLEDLKVKGYVYESEGALWLRTSEFGDDKDRVLRKSDGTYTYFASDIAYHWEKFRRGFEKVIDLWGADHHGYIPRVKAALDMLGIPKEWLEVYLIQMVKLFRDGSEVKMSKRAGTFVTLRELLEEVGPDAVRFVFLTKRSDTPLDFDVDMVKEKSSENPVFYVQYAHARIAGVFREARERFGLDPEEEDLSGFLAHLNEDAEIRLMKKTLIMKDELVDITLRRDPHMITYLLMDMAGLFHHYYNHHRIIGSEENIMKGRLALLKGIRTTLRLSLKLIGVSAPERM